MLDFKQNR